MKPNQEEEEDTLEECARPFLEHDPPCLTAELNPGRYVVGSAALPTSRGLCWVLIDRRTGKPMYAHA